MADLDNDQVKDLEIGIIGGGSMGGVSHLAAFERRADRQGMTLLFAEHGSTVGCFDKSADAVKAILHTATETDTVDNAKVHGFSTLEKLVAAFPKANSGSEKKPRIFVLSLPHGKVPDAIADELLPLLDKGDIIIDGGNEWWEATERRQKKAKEVGVEWVGMGVSGGCKSVLGRADVRPSC